jgi:predicted component of type VI protein secretion system
LRQGEAYLLEDLGSSNGTYVNDQKLSAPHVLEDEDRIRIGSHYLVFRAPSSPTEPQSPRPPVPTLVMTCGERVVEKELDHELELHYTVKVGLARLRGVAGRVLPRDGEIWLEPTPGRSPIVLNGKATSAAARLTAGDHFEVGNFVFEYRDGVPKHSR